MTLTELVLVNEPVSYQYASSNTSIQAMLCKLVVSAECYYKRSVESFSLTKNLEQQDQKVKCTYPGLGLFEPKPMPPVDLRLLPIEGPMSSVISVIVYRIQ
jgi:hypothetical protein